MSETWPPEINGVALTAARTVGWLRERGHAVDVVRPRQPHEARGRAGDELRPPGLPLPFYREVRFGVAFPGLLRRQFLRHEAQLVHVATPGPLGYAAVLAARALGIALTTDFRTNFHQYIGFYGAGALRPVILGYLRHFHNKGMRTFVPTHALRVELAARGFEGLEVIGRGVDDRLFSPAKRCRALRARWGVGESDPPVLLCVGRLAPEKGLELVLDAFERLRASTPGLRMVVVGDGPQRQRLAHLYPHVVFAGWQRGEDLARHYASADLFVQPSRSETFGNVTIEAMASGLPVLAFDTAAAAQHIRHLDNGLLVPCADEQGFVEALHEALSSPERLQRLGRRARETARSLRWDSVLGEFEATLARVARPDPFAWSAHDAAGS